MRRLALWVVNNARWVIVGAVVFVIGAAILGRDVASQLSAGGFENSSSESVRTAKDLLAGFPAAGEPDFVVLVTARDGTVDDPAVVAAGLRLTEQLARDPAVIEAGSYWSLSNAPPLKSTDGREALVIGTLRGGLGERVETAERLSPALTTRTPVITTEVTGQSEVARQVSARSEKDVQRAEIISTPITAIALVLVFGSMVAAGLPLAIGVVAVVGTLLALHVIASITEVSIFALNLTTGLGLGLAIDYSLFIVSRYREELAAGASSRVAVGRTMQTAGRTIVFSAATVMISLLALLLFPFPYVRSFAYAGVAVVALAAVAAILVLPAVLVLLGPRVEKGRLFKVREARDGGFWRRQAERVLRHPWPYLLGVSALLLVLAIPFLRITLGQIDDRVVPPDVASSRAAADQIRAHFTSRENGALRVSLPGVDPTTDAARIDALAKKLRVLPGVARVDAATGFYFKDGTTVPAIATSPLTARFFSDDAPHATWINVVPNIEPISKQGEQLVRDVRDILDSPRYGVAGPSARLVDAKHTIASRLPLALGFIALVTFLLLFLMTGSVLVPIKALVLNLLSLTATFGAMVFIFQDGRFSDLLGYTPTGAIDTFTPLLMFCIAFGLSMDYEVFLLSRIKEEYDYDHDNTRAVAVGLGKTGQIVTAAALVLTIVFLGLTTSEVLQVKLFGLGLALAILVDAFLIRATLVPALMRLAGRANWWAPKFVRRWHLRFGIWEKEPIRILDRASISGNGALASGAARWLYHHTMTAFAPLAPTVHFEPLEIAPETFLIQQVQPACGQPLFVYLNSLVIRGKEPVIVDTGTPANREQWLEDVFSLVDPVDVKWIYVSHDDVDHSGNLAEALDACPNANLVCTWAMVERHTNCFEFPLARCRWIDDGGSFDAGDRVLAAVRPPYWDSPTTRGLFDASTGVYWAIDSFATPLPGVPMQELDDIDEEFWHFGMTLFALGGVSPWLGMVDPAKFNAHVDKIQNLDITTIAACHTPVLRGNRIDEAFAFARNLPNVDCPPLPDQSVLDQIVAATSQPVS